MKKRMKNKRNKRREGKKAINQISQSINASKDKIFITSHQLHTFLLLSQCIIIVIIIVTVIGDILIFFVKHLHQSSLIIAL